MRCQIGLGLQLLFEARQALFRTANPKRELVLVEKAFGVTIDQTRNRLLNLADLCFYRLQIRVNVGRGESPPVLYVESLWTLQESAHLSQTADSSRSPLTWVFVHTRPPLNR